MYFTKFHIFTVFASFVIYIFLQFLIYYFYKDKKKFFTFSVILFCILPVLSYSILLSIDAALKDCELRNIKDYKSNKKVIFYANIYNTGKAPIKTCKISIRIINQGIKKVDGSIFDTNKSFDRFIRRRPRNSYSHDFVILGKIDENSSKTIRLNIPYPEHFKDYKLKYNLSCK